VQPDKPQRDDDEHHDAQLHYRDAVGQAKHGQAGTSEHHPTGPSLTDDSHEAADREEEEQGAETVGDQAVAEHAGQPGTAVGTVD